MGTDAGNSVYRQLEGLAAEIPGWTPVDQLYTLYLSVLLTAPLGGDVLEIGSWCGRSSSVLGLAARASGGTRVHCLDLFPEKDYWRRNPYGTWSFELEIDGRRYGAYQEQTVWEEPYLRDIAPLYERHRGILEIFRESIEGRGLDDVVRWRRGTSDLLGTEPPGTRFRLAFVDGDHSYAGVCRDIDNIAPRLLPGGWICFDDAFSHYEGVNRAITDRIIESPDFEMGRQMTRKFFMARRRPV